MEHHFDIDIATKYWIEEAIIINNLKHWLIKNIANEVNLYDWYYWTYNSSSAFSKIFPYMSAKKISRILLNLEEKEIIKSWNYNKSPYDKTKWYTIRQKEIIDCSFLSNRVTESVQPIPDNKQYNKQYTLYNDNDSSANSKINTNSTNNESLVNVNNKESPTSKELVNERNKKRKPSDEDASSIYEYYTQVAFPKKTKHKRATSIDRILDTLKRYSKKQIIDSILRYKDTKKETIQKQEWIFIKTCDNFFWFEKWSKIKFIENFISNEEHKQQILETNKEIKLEDQDNVDWL